MLSQAEMLERGMATVAAAAPGNPSRIRAGMIDFLGRLENP
jgi:hypothetical protein